MEPALLQQALSYSAPFLAVLMCLKFGLINFSPEPFECWAQQSRLEPDSQFDHSLHDFNAFYQAATEQIDDSYVDVGSRFRWQCVDTILLMVMFSFSHYLTTMLGRASPVLVKCTWIVVSLLIG